VGQSVFLAGVDHNQIVVLVEKAINGKTPAPVFPPVSFPPGPVESLALHVSF